MTKQDLRKEMKCRERDSLSRGLSASESERIISRVEALPEFRSASVVLAYMALPGEVETCAALKRWRLAGKKVAIPLVCGQDLELREYRPECLRPGYAGIFEPSPDAPVVSPGSIELALVPGLAFARTEAGVLRLGRGKGFYDRLLPSLDCPLAGICFPFRVVDSIPADPWDYTLDMLVY